jgi:hypothetical protein
VFATSFYNSGGWRNGKEAMGLFLTHSKEIPGFYYFPTHSHDALLMLQTENLEQQIIHFKIAGEIGKQIHMHHVISSLI